MFCRSCIRISSTIDVSFSIFDRFFKLEDIIMNVFNLKYYKIFRLDVIKLDTLVIKHRSSRLVVYNFLSKIIIFSNQIIQLLQAGGKGGEPVMDPGRGAGIDLGGRGAETDPLGKRGGGPATEQVCPSENRRLNSDSKRHDVRSLGAFMMELMESMTYILDAQSRKMKDAWKQDCIIKLTSSCSFIPHALISQATNNKATSSKSHKVYGILKQTHS